MKRLNFKKLTSLILTLMMLFSIIAPSNSISAKAAEAPAKITVLATSDIHGSILGWDYNAAAPADFGLAKVNTLVKQERQSNPNNILVGAGDFLQGSPIDSYYNTVDKNWDVHPMIQVYNKMGYDALVLGNHEFNYGKDFLKDKVLSKANFDVLSANTYDTSQNGVWDAVKQYKIKEFDVNGEKVKAGIIGVTTPAIPNWENAQNIEGLEFKDQVEVVKNVVSEIKDKVDIIIVVTHSGVEGVDPTELNGENEVSAIAKACPEVSLIVCGHIHKVIDSTTNNTNASIQNGKVNGIPVMEPGKNGQYLAKADLSLAKVNGKWTVSNVATTDLALKGVKEDSDIVSIAKPYHDTVINYLKSKIGVAKDTIPVGTALRDSSIVDLVNDVQRYYGNADISQAAVFNASASIKKGDITLQDVYGLYGFENFLYTIKINGKQLKQYLEWSAKYYKQFNSGNTGVQIDSTIPSYNYDMVQGVNYVIDITQPVGSRIKNLTFKGKEVKDTDTFKFAINNYRFNGGGDFMKAMGFDKTNNKPEVLFDSQKAMGDNGQVRNLIIDYIQNVKKGNLTQKDIVDSTTWSISPKFVDVLSVNDFHGQMETLSKKDSNGNVTAKYGADILAGKINELKAANPDTILVSAGDMFQGTPMSNVLQGKPVVDLMNYLGFTSMTIGNHEFDWGIDTFKNISKNLNATVLACNIFDSKTGKRVSFAQPYKMVTVGGKKLAIIGVTTPETKYKASPSVVKYIDVRDPAVYVKVAAWEARRKGADYVIVVGHLSAFQDSKTNVITGEAADLAKVLRKTEVDAIVSGHSHQTIAGTAYGIPVVQGYYAARAIGHLSFAIDTLNNDKLLSVGASVEDTYKNFSKITPDKTAQDIVKAADEKLGPQFNQLVGKTDVDLISANAKYAESNMADFITDVERNITGVDIVFGNSGNYRADIQKGDVTVKSVYSVLPFDNTICTMKLTGAQIMEILEHGVDPNNTVGLIQVSGIKVKYDSSKPNGQRVLEVTLLDGSKLDLNKEYTVEANDFLATGGDNYSTFTKAKDFVNTYVPTRDAVMNYIKNLQKEGKSINTQVDGRLVDVKAQ